MCICLTWGFWLKCRLWCSRSGAGPKFWISNKLLGEAATLLRAAFNTCLLSQVCLFVYLSTTFCGHSILFTHSTSCLYFQLTLLWNFCAANSLLLFKTGLTFAFLMGISCLINLLALWWWKMSYWPSLLFICGPRASTHSRSWEPFNDGE